MMFRAIRRTFVPFAALIALIPVATYAQATPAAPADVQAQIQSHNAQITQLQSEIDTYQKQLNVVSSQKQTLQTAIQSIDLTRQKTSAQINQTQNKIASSNLQLAQLGTQIGEKTQAIELDKETLAASIRNIDASDDSSIIEQMLAADTLADSWAAADQLASLTSALHTHTENLLDDKADLSTKESSVASQKDQLTGLKTDLTTQQGQLDATKSAKSQLLTQTKAQESSYQSIIAQKKAQEKAFETELSSLENSLKPVAEATIPHVGQGILSWPFSAAFAQSCLGKASVLGNNFCITQYFGNTPFSTANPQVYNGAGHNAIDIGMPIGTPVQAALSGTVLGTGNTDLSHDAAGNQCLSFGKWVMVKHANGLDTLYAHLSQIGVSAGQAVTTGQVLGYSGMTGYATGPHLHFGVYASSGVQITTLGQYRGAQTPCQNATMPVSPVSGYLNPMSYL